MIPLERNLQRRVLKHLEKLRQSDPTLVYRKRHGTVMGVTGDPDIYGLWAGTHFEIELKRAGEEPTERQRLRCQEWALAGARGAVIHNLVELTTFLSQIRPRPL